LGHFNKYLRKIDTSPIMSFTPIVAESQLEPEEDRGQLGASESRVIDTKSFRKCHISTTLNDLVPCQFIDGRDGKKRDACVMFFQFNFGLQKQGSDQRITSMTVEVNIEEGEEAEVRFLRALLGDTTG
jgi:hypothetical protein